MQICPDFDIFIDDNPNIIKKAVENINDKNKNYILPNYKTNLHVEGDNIHHVETTVSDLTDQDFSIAVLELETKRLEQELKVMQTEERQKRKEQQRWRERERELYRIIGIGAVILLLGILPLLRKKAALNTRTLKKNKSR